MRWVAFLVGCGLLLAAGRLAAEDAVRATIERSLPFIEREGQRWIDEKKCVTCHQVPFMVWAQNAAADRGLALDRQKLADHRTWATDWQHMATKAQLEQGEELTLSGHPDAVAQLLLGRSATDRDDATKWPALFARCLATGQQDDGSWKPGGQLPDQKRPLRETQEVTTMWALVALRSYVAADPSLEARFAKARSWLGDRTDGQSTEWWAARLLLEQSSGDRTAAERIRDGLLKRQHEDGGWGWLCDAESDAFGTGLALYALSRDGLSTDHLAIVQGRQYLASSQRADGSWAVNGTKKGKAKQVEPTATYWGTCWAVIGLAEMLPRSFAAE
jgi:Prenyltransferase and squalene oxidase repeat